MKQFVFIFIALFLCFTKNVQAQELRDGYVVLSRKDTINCKIVFGGPKGTDKTQISIVTKEGEEKIFKTKDKKVFAYGFNQVGVPFDYLFVDRGIKVETGFYKLVEKGNPYKLYIQNINSTSKGVIVTTSYYILFDENGDSLDFFVSGVSGWKKKLEVFFEKDPAALEKLEDVSRQDIVQFIKSLNGN